MTSHKDMEKVHDRTKRELEGFLGDGCPLLSDEEKKRLLAVLDFRYSTGFIESYWREMGYYSAEGNHRRSYETVRNALTE